MAGERVIWLDLPDGCLGRPIPGILAGKPAAKLQTGHQVPDFGRRKGDQLEGSFAGERGLKDSRTAHEG
jgi:hypothetical protein